ncbi:hypothetical protein [Undibacterium sp. Tian12W]|uniref:hypothetical protein n=1 Tax=Undibacterium sp. Tian12W TaxID=3413054 RepID=UPI003BEFEFE3
MNNLKRISILATVYLLLSGCAVIEPAIKPTMAPEKGTGYVSGKFMRSSSAGFAFVLVNQTTKTEYSISLGEDGLLSEDTNNRVITIKVPPGKYVVKYWYTYGTLSRDRSSKHQVISPDLSAPFIVSSGSVVFLGNYTTVSEYANSTARWMIRPRIASEDQARYDFGEAFPLLAKLNFSCHVCRRY